MRFWLEDCFGPFYVDDEVRDVAHLVDRHYQGGVAGFLADAVVASGAAPSSFLIEARDWILDCFEDAPVDLSDDEIVAAVERHYHGGLAGFLADVVAS